MVTVAREHFATVLGGLENMGDGEPSDSKGSKKQSKNFFSFQIKVLWASILTGSSPSISFKV